MKIVVVGTRGFPDVQGGVETHCENLYPELAKLGCKVTVFTRIPYANPQRKEYRGVRLMPERSIKNKFIETFFHTYQCIRLAKKIKPDIIHIHAIGPSFFARRARQLTGAKVVVTHHGPDYKRKKWPWAAKLFLRYCEWRGMAKADNVITLEPGLAGVIEKKFKRKPEVIPNGVWVRARSGEEEAVHRFGLVKKKYLIAVGRLVAEKGFHDLIDAYARLKETGLSEEWKLVICGAANHSDRYSEDLIRQAEQTPGVVLTGHLNAQELCQLYSHAGLFVLSSYYEGLPIVVLEALSYGLAYLVTDIKAVQTLELDKNRLFKPGNVEELAGKLKEFIDKPLNEEEKHTLIRNIREKYSWNLIAEQTLDVYKKVLLQAN